MKKYTFDFSQINDISMFFYQFTVILTLKEKQVHDLDSLWDTLVGSTIKLPFEGNASNWLNLMYNAAF